MSELALPLPPAVVAKKVKPRLRGVLHFLAFFASLFGIADLAIAPVEGWRWAAGLIYASSLSLMLGLSALYHRPMWSHAARHRLRHLDHAGIFFLIAGTYTPLAAFVSPHAATPGLVGMWGGAVLGIVIAMINIYGHRGLRAAVYVVLGLSAAPMILSLPAHLGWGPVVAMLVSSGIYIAGAGVYARRWPNPRPHVFGYHELFHALVIIAAAMQYAVVWGVQQR